MTDIRVRLCRIIAALSALLLCVSALSATDALPIDSALRHGVLPNGLTYYIRSNSTPAGRADFRLVHKVGSAMERESERGLAHFLEHMAFAGTKNFDEDKLFYYLTGNGLAFGADVNATTGYDETQYYVTHVPTARATMLDSVLLIMRDLSCNLLIPDDAIDRERAIIADERTSHGSLEMSVQECAMPGLMRGSHFADRLPIGLPSIVAGATRQQLIDFYHRWYRPDRQALIVVGDFDARLIERKVRRIFGAVPVPTAPMPEVDLSVPDHQGLRVVRCLNADADAAMLALYFKHDDLPLETRGTMAYVDRQITKSLVLGMLKARVDRLLRQPQCPLVSLTLDDAHYIAARSKEAFNMTAIAKHGQVGPAWDALLTEARRAAKYGFAETELRRAKANLSSQFAQYALQVGHHESEDYAQEYIDHFFSGGYIPGVVAEVELSRQVIERLSIGDVNRYMSQLVRTDNACLLLAGPDKEKYPSDDELGTRFVDILTSDVPAAELPEASVGTLMPALPQPGRIVAEQTDTVFQTTTLRLSNGATVVLRPSRLKTGEILFDAVCPGGRWSCDSTQAALAWLMDDAIEESRLGGHCQDQLGHLLAGARLSLVFELDDDCCDMFGGCSSEELESLLQLCYLYFTQVTADDEAFSALKSRQLSMLRQRRGTPEALLADSTVMAHYGAHPLMLQPAEQQVADADYQQLLALYQCFVSHPERYTFVLAGDFDIERARPLVERYIASLPVDTCITAEDNARAVPLIPGRRTVSLPGQDDERAQVYVTLSGPAQGTLEEITLLNCYGHVLEMALNAKLREDTQLTYGVSVNTLMTTEPRWMLKFDFTCKPDDVTAGLESADEVRLLLAVNGVNEQLFDKVKALVKRRHEESLRGNAYWVLALRQCALGRDLHTGLSQMLDTLTSERFDAYMRDISLGCDTEISIVVGGKDLR